MSEQFRKEGLVRRLSPELNGKKRSYLRSLAHDLDPVLQVGDRGISENLLENLKAQLLAHELVKVKVNSGDAMEEVAETFNEETGAQLVQKIGNMLVFYKEHPEDPEIELP